MATIKVPGIQAIKNKRTGKTYIYHRKTGTRIRAESGTPEFLAEVQRLNALVPPPRDGSFGGLVQAYKASPEFAALAPRTRADYDKVFDYLKPFDRPPILEFSTRMILRVRDKAYAERKRRFANYCVQVLSLVFAWGKSRGWLEGLSNNPAKECPAIRRPRNARKVNRAWAPEDIRAVLESADGGLKAAIALAAFAGLSEGDVIRFPWSGYDRERIRYVWRKNGVLVSIPALTELRSILAATPRRSPIVVAGVQGRPFTENGFRATFFKVIRGLVAEKKVERGLTFHGLRHALGKAIVDAGGSSRDAAVAIGDRTEQMGQHHSQEADRERRATVAFDRPHAASSTVRERKKANNVKSGV